MNENAYRSRLERHETELKELYMGLYGNEAMYESLLAGLEDYHARRSEGLKVRDAEKGGTDWYKSGDLLGMMLYIDNFAGNLRGVRKKSAIWSGPTSTIST